MSDLWPESHPTELKDAELERQVEQLFARMSLEQKVGQMVQADIRYITPEQAGEYHIGSILSGGGSTPNNDLHASVQDWLDLADAFHQAASAAGAVLPPIWGVDAVHGHNNLFGATLFPHNIGLGAAHNPALIEKIAAATALEVRVSGLDWNFAPSLAVARDDRWGRTYESYGETQSTIASYAAEFVRGMQGAPESETFLDDSRVIATAKHFVGDGGTKSGEDQGDTWCDESELFSLHGQGYPIAIAAGVQTIMASFNSWRGEKLHGHRYLLTEVLKERMGFEGVIVGDWNGHGQLPEGSNEDAAQAVSAGIDVIMVPEDWQAVYENLIHKVNSGEVTLARIDDAVRRILRLKLRYGVSFETKPSERPYSGRADLVGCDAHRSIARQAVRESAVLLKNEGNVLPIETGKKVLLVGPGVDNIAMQCGGWSLSWQGDGVSNDDFPGATSIGSAIASAIEEAQGSVLNDMADAASADLAIVVFGEQPYAEGEGDLESLGFSSMQPEALNLLSELKSKQVPTVSIFISGRPLWVNPELNASDAFVAAWLPGSEAAGLADLLFAHRQFDFKGKLTFSWPARADQSPLNLGDPDYDPLFAVGHGLSLRELGQLGVLDESADVEAESDEDVLAIFERRPLAPFSIYAGDEQEWHSPVDRARFRSKGEVVEVSTADWQRQEDARKVVWHGGPGQFYFASDSAIDVSETFVGGSLLVDLCVHQHPESSVLLRQDSRYPKSASYNLTDQLLKQPLNEWVQLEIELSDFMSHDFQPGNLTSPFLIFTDGVLSLSIGLVKLLAPGYELAPPAKLQI